MKKFIFLFVTFLSLLSCRNEDVIKTEDVISNKIVIKTNPPTFVSQIQVDFEGEIVKNDNNEITQYGMLIGDRNNPTIEDNLGNQINPYTKGTTKFNSSFFDLIGNKVYYLRFYVKTGDKTIYGDSVSFTSLKHKKPAEEYITLATQQQVNDFGSNNYTYVFDLKLSGNITDLSPLNSLLKVGNTLNIKYTSELQSLNGLNSLKLIGTEVSNGGGLYIDNNAKLSLLTGLDNLIFTGHLVVYDNPLLKNLQGLGKLDQVWISTFLAVPSFDGLPLNFRTGEFESRGFKGKNLGGRTIKIEAYNFTLLDAPNINDLTGFSVYDYQNSANFLIEKCDALENLTGLVVANKYHQFAIQGCKNFKSFEGLSGLQEVDYFLVHDLPRLTTLSGLQGLTKVNNVFGVVNSGITNISGLNSQINFKSLVLKQCDQFNNLQDFSTSMKINNLGFFACNALTNLNGLSNVSNIESLDFYSNANLSDYCPLKSIMTKNATVLYTCVNNAQNPTKLEVLNNCP